MKELIINSANSNLIVLLNCDGKVSFLNEESVQKHNEIILTLIDDLLKKNNIALKDIDSFGVVVGPGSFTGIRVGIATIKAFRDVFNKRAIGINNLNFLYELSKGENLEVFAIEGSLNSYFVAEVVNEKLFIYNKNLTTEELKKIANARTVGVFKITDRLNAEDINFVELKFNEEALLRAFHTSEDEKLVPVYYQLSQAEEEKLKKSEVEILNASMLYLDEIKTIEAENFSDKAVGEPPLSEDEIKKILENHMPKYVAKIDEKIVGYIFLEKTDEINISRVAVKREYQNHGIATKMINHVIEDGKLNKLNVSLEVSINNLRAKRLYKKLSFELRRIRKNYYRDGADCEEMVFKV